MLKNLYVKNFILFDELALDFEEGFSAFTGETGAGKSIMIDAISLLCSERSSTSFIKKGKDKAIIEGTFSLENDKHACDILQDAGFDINDYTIFTREIDSNGKSQSRIDHRVVTFSFMQDVLKYQIDIHNQRDTSYLLDVKSHRHLLDEFIGNKEILDKTKQAYEIYDSLCKEKSKALEEEYNESDLEFFQYQLSEINDANLKVGEEEELKEKENTINAYKSSYEALNNIISIYRNQIEDPLYELNHLVQSLEENDTFQTIKNNVNDTYYTLDDSVSMLSQSLSNFDFNEDTINEIQERLFIIQKLKRKYGNSISDILKTRDDLEYRISYYSNKQKYLEDIDKKIDEAKKSFDTTSNDLSELRKTFSKKLDKLVAQSLKDLGLENAQFKTDITKANPSSYGIDAIEFLISMNKGESLKPLNKTASGGELSRLMLGLKEIFTELQQIQTVIFDEIDTGVSGKIATAIGLKMKSLSKNAQVFSVTHLAQVAACSDHHFLVQKESQKNITTTTIHELNKEERIQELALISNGSITDASLEAAKELLERNQS